MRSSLRTLPATLVLGVLLAFGVSPASAVTAADIPAPVSLMSGESPFVSTDPSTGTTLVVAVDASTSSIIGRLFNADLVALGASFTISESGIELESPSAAWNPEDGQWLVVWHDDNNPSLVNGRMLALNGTFVTSQFLIADQDLNGENFGDSELVFASYAADQDGFLVAFKTTVQISSCQVAMVSWVGADGTVPTTAATPVSSDDPSDVCNQIDNGADLAYSTADSEWTVAWYDESTDQTMIRRIGTGATPAMLGAPVAVGVNASGASAAVAYDQSRNRMLLGWHTWATDGNDAVGALLSAADVATPTSIAVGSADLDWRKPRLVYVSATDQYYAALHDQEEQDVYLVQIDAADGIAESPLLLEDAGIMTRPSISTDGQCAWIVWQNNNDDSDIRGTTTCRATATAQLAATGQDPTILAATAVLAFLLVGIGVAITRRRGAVSPR